MAIINLMQSDTTIDSNAGSPWREPKMVKCGIHFITYLYWYFIPIESGPPNFHCPEMLTVAVAR